MHVCMYVCICMYVCMHTYIHTCILTSVHGAGREARAASSILRGGRLVAYLCNRHYIMIYMYTSNEYIHYMSLMSITLVGHIAVMW
jgi:hypothetical protein